MAMELISTYVKNLDRELGGGIPKGHIILISGTPGTYKSSLAFNIVYHSSKEGMGAIYTLLEQSRDSLLLQMGRMGYDVRDSALKDLHISDLGKIRQALSGVEPKSWEKGFRGYIESLVEEHLPEVLVIDSLPVLEILSYFKNRREYLFHLFSWLKSLQLTTILVNEKPSITSPFGDEDFLADGILQTALKPIGTSDLQRQIRCIKLRAMDHNTSWFALEFRDGGFRIAPAI